LWDEDVDMLGVTDIWTYIIGTVAIILLPGPNSLYVLSTAARHGVRAGYRAAAGVFLGDWALMAAAALGVASLLKAYPPVFFVVKWAGAGYLAYVGINMAVQAIRKARRPVVVEEAAVGEPAAVEASSGVGRPFRRALVISLLNPKAILFFISFFVQFIDPTYAHPALTFLVLGVIVQICSALYLTGLIFGGTYLAAQFGRRRRLAAGLTAGVGAIFLAFGLRLATASM
jgi:leucine efflux protein